MRRLADIPRSVVVVAGSAAGAAAVAAVLLGSRLLGLAALVAGSVAAVAAQARVVMRQRNVAARGDALAGEVERLRAEVDQLSRDRDRIVERLRAAEARGTHNARDVEASSRATQRLGESLAEQRTKLSEVAASLRTVEQNSARIEQAAERIERLHEEHTRLAQLAESVRAEAAIADDANRRAIAGVRSDLSHLSAEVYGEVDAVPSLFTMGQAPPPLLSIAIPAFNRPDQLEVCLASIVREVAMSATTEVELCITDDASPDRRAAVVAHRFAAAHDFISLHVNERNLGLERNLIRACEPCTGRYLLIMGNDDAFVEGAMPALLDDLRRGEYAAYLYEKRRVDTSLRPLPAVPGSTPIAIDAGEIHRFESPLAMAAATGLLSAYGFISQLVMQREPFLSVGAETYFDLTLYPHVGVLLEAFDGTPVAYHNHELVLHRTTTRAEKWSESIGRPEEHYMEGGRRKLGEYFGYRLAAFFERVAARTSATREQLATMPERLFTDIPVVEWIERNISIGEQLDLELPAEVVADAESWLSAVGSVRRDSA